METQILEALFLLTSAMVLPAVAVLAYQFVVGNLTDTERNRSLALLDPEPDYWSSPPPRTGRREARGKGDDR